MTDTVLLVDYENIGKIDLGAIPAGVRVPFFFGASQKSVPTEFLKAALKLGDRFAPIDIEGQGKNALDFHIAFYLGEYLTRSPETACVILSKDKGFDPLIRHLVRRGFAVRRANSMAEALAGARVFSVETGGGRPYSDATFEHGDALLFGSETRGLPPEVIAQLPPERQLAIPMRAGNRSLNLSNAVALVVYEAWRQNDFAGAGVPPQ